MKRQLSRRVCNTTTDLSVHDIQTKRGRLIESRLFMRPQHLQALHVYFVVKIVTHLTGLAAAGSYRTQLI